MTWGSCSWLLHKCLTRNIAVHLCTHCPSLSPYDGTIPIRKQRQSSCLLQWNIPYTFFFNLPESSAIGVFLRKDGKFRLKQGEGFHAFDLRWTLKYLPLSPPYPWASCMLSKALPLCCTHLAISDCVSARRWLSSYGDRDSCKVTCGSARCLQVWSWPVLALGLAI